MGNLELFSSPPAQDPTPAAEPPPSSRAGWPEGYIVSCGRLIPEEQADASYHAMVEEDRRREAALQERHLLQAEYLVIRPGSFQVKFERPYPDGDHVTSIDTLHSSGYRPAGAPMVHDGLRRDEHPAQTIAPSP